MKGTQMNEVLLSWGPHRSREIGMCAMEFAAYLAGLEHTDRPVCVSPALVEFMTSFNDSLDDEKRQGLRPYIVRTLGTAGDGQDRNRQYMCLDWIVRTYTAAFMAAAGLHVQAGELRALADIKDMASCESAELVVGSARAAVRSARAAAAGDADARAAAAGDADARAAAATAAADAWDTARAVAWDAVRDAAWDAVGDAAGPEPSRSSLNSVEDAARVGVWDAARGAAWDAAVVAAWGARAALQPTVEMLQESAFDLLDRMIDPGGIHDVRTEEQWLDKIILTR